MEKEVVVVQPVQANPVITKEVSAPVKAAPEAAADPAPDAKPAEGQEPKKDAAPVEEVKTDPVKEDQSKDDKYTGKIAKLRERERLVEERENNAAEAIKKAEAIVTADNETKALIKKRPLEALKRLGITFEELTKAVLEEEEPDPKYDALKGELEEVKGKLSAEEKAKEDAKKTEEQQRLDAATEGFKNRIKEVVEKGEDKFELIKLNEAHDLVFDVVEEYYQAHGTILDPEKAAEHVEDWLLKKAELLSKSKKLQPKPAEGESAKPVEKTTPTKTLTNQASNFAAPVLPAGQKLSKEDRLKKAAALLSFN